jgi:hypothetical protein
MSFAIEELTSAISNWEEENGLRNNLFMELWYEDAPEELPTLDGIGKVEFVDSWGGEGDGAEIFVVIKVGDRYFQRTGYYSSWGESRMDGKLEEVKPVQVMRTEYESV